MTTIQGAEESTLVQRYIQLAVLVVVAGAIYPLIYLRQNFEVTILESFGITAKQLGQNYAMLGVLFVVTYVPSGWLADRVSPRILMSFSLAFAGVLGIWFSTMPSFGALQVIFAGWGIATGLTFWCALIKATALLAQPEEQGRFFGILDGGRGLVEAILATIAVAMFAYWLQQPGQDASSSLNKVIWFYVIFMLIMAPLVLLIVKDNRPDDDDVSAEQAEKSTFFTDLRSIIIREEIWLCAFCILTGYQLFWATYSFSAYMQTHYNLTAVTVGSITVAKLWMRPIGAAAAGFAGDFLDRERVLGILLFVSALALAGLVVLPAGAATIVLLGMVMLRR